MGPFSLPASEGILDEAFLEDRLEDADEGVVDDPVAKRSRRDRACLRVVDLKIVIAAVLVSAAEQFRPQRDEFLFVVGIELRCRTARSFAPPSFAGGGKEILVGADLLKKMPMPLHRILQTA
jgi:hypothetical protein